MTSAPSRPILGELVVKPLAARNLPSKDFLREKQDPFVECTIEYEVHKTRIDRGGGSRPSWNDILKFEIKQGRVQMTVRVFASTLLDRRLIGECKVELLQVLTAGRHDGWFAVQDRGKAVGDVYIELTYRPALPGQFDAQDVPLTQGVQGTTPAAAPAATPSPAKVPPPAIPHSNVPAHQQQQKPPTQTANRPPSNSFNYPATVPSYPLSTSANGAAASASVVSSSQPAAPQMGRPHAQSVPGGYYPASASAYPHQYAPAAGQPQNGAQPPYAYQQSHSSPALAPVYPPANMYPPNPTGYQQQPPPQPGYYQPATGYPPQPAAANGGYPPTLGHQVYPPANGQVYPPISAPTQQRPPLPPRIGGFALPNWNPQNGHP